MIVLYQTVVEVSSISNKKFKYSKVHALLILNLNLYTEHNGA